MTDTAPEQADPFADVLAANETFAHSFEFRGLEGRAALGLGMLTCMDSRIPPLEMLGIEPGDAIILRNAGAHVTTDVLRTLVLATHLLGVQRMMVVAHTQCKMASVGQDEIIEQIGQSSGIDVSSLNFGILTDQQAVLRRDVSRIKAWPFFPPGLAVGGFLYDVDTGLLTAIC